MLKFRHARPVGARTSSLLAGMALVALLSACGSAPEAANNAVADNVANVANEVENAAVNEAEPANAANAAQAPEEKEEAKPAAEAAAAPKPEAKAVETAAAAPAGGDAANGAKLFAQCKICHSTDEGKNGIGPSLHGVVGRKAATLAGFNFSPAMKGSDLTWTDPTLDDYLKAPMKKVPGTKMAFAGIANDKNRADVIAYLDTLK